MPFTVQKFSSLRLSVKNLQASRDWFRKFFETEPKEDLPYFVSFALGGITLELSEGDEKSPHSRGNVGYWRVEGLEGAVERARELGGKIHRGPLRVVETRSTIVQIESEAGDVFGLEEG